MDSRRLLFIAGCVALITSAFSFQVRQMISDPLAADFSLTKQSVGVVMAAAFLGMCVSMLVFSPLCDTFGMGKIMGLAWLSHLFGILCTIFAMTLSEVSVMQSMSGVVSGFARTLFSWMPGMEFPGADNHAFWILWLGTFLIGAGNGLVEVAINPMAATLFPEEKTHYLNVLHAWWPGGLVLAGLLGVFVVDRILGTHEKNAPADAVSLSWKIKMGMMFVPLLIYGAISATQRFPKTERVQANISPAVMWGQTIRPMFLIWAFCMLLTAATELGVNSWQESVLTRTTGVSGTLIFVYTSLLMFTLRFFAGPIAHALSPVGMLTLSATLAAGGLFWLSFADGFVTAFMSATIFGIGIAYFWPTMLGVTAERFPKGGPLVLGLMGSVGNLAIAFVLPLMGSIYDSFTVSNLPEDVAAMTFNDGKTDIPVVLVPKDLAQVKSDSILPGDLYDFLYPAGTKKLNPALTANLRKFHSMTPEERTEAEAVVVREGGKLTELKTLTKLDDESITKAEAQGAAYAYRRVAILPCLLIVIFGGIALLDKFRGGYKAELITHGT